MRHRVKRKTLGKKSTARMAMLIAQVEALVDREKIQLPLIRAKQVRSIAEKLITKGKDGSVASRRIIASRLINKDKAKKFVELGTRYKERPGGYTRIIRLGMRKGDASKMSVLELV